jgi:hypothetical protein
MGKLMSEATVDNPKQAGKQSPVTAWIQGSFAKTGES